MARISGLRLSPPFRAEHIGSLLRPKALYEKREQLARGLCVASDLIDIQDEAIKHVVELQQSVGIKTITDGELRRASFYDGVFENLEGMTLIPNRPIATFNQYLPHAQILYAGLQEAESMFCSGKIRRTKSFYVEDFKYLKGLVAVEDVKFIKVTMCSPSWFHQRHGSDFTYDLAVYKNDDEYFEDLGKAYRQEIAELYELGCRHIQIDDPTFCYFCDERMIADMKQAGVDHEALFDTYIRAINLCTRGRPGDLTIGTHMCRGNYKGGVFFSEGSYSRIASKLFSELDVDTFYLEYDTKRAGDFTPLKHLPLDKVVVLGLVTTKSPKLESIEDLKARVNEAVSVICTANPSRRREDALNQLCISTQCGFASVWQGNPISEEDERKKLTLLVKTAQQIWPQNYERINVQTPRSDVVSRSRL